MSRAHMRVYVLYEKNVIINCEILILSYTSNCYIVSLIHTHKERE